MAFQLPAPSSLCKAAASEAALSVAWMPQKVEEYEEQIEAAHDGRRDGDVGLEQLGSVVAAVHWVGGS